MTIDIHINIGSNSGHREALIEQAVAAVSSAFAGAEVSCSDVIETPPWGFESPNPFLNVGMMLRIPMACSNAPVGTLFKASTSSPVSSAASISTPILPASHTPELSSELSGDSGMGISSAVVDALKSVPTDDADCHAVCCRVALDVLHELQRIQTAIDPSPHRDADGRYIDRAIDIDLIAISDWIIDTPELTIPHPRMHLRDFVLLPLAALAPGWRHPALGSTVEELIAGLGIES